LDGSNPGDFDDRAEDRDDDPADGNAAAVGLPDGASALNIEVH
jgi:hypothetical protein